MNQAKNVQDKWDVFFKVYKEGTEKFVPRYVPKNNKIKGWFNRRCENAKQMRETAWKKMRKRNNSRTRENYKEKEMSAQKFDKKRNSMKKI